MIDRLKTGAGGGAPVAAPADEGAPGPTEAAAVAPEATPDATTDATPDTTPEATSGAEPAPAPARSRFSEVGWLIDGSTPHFIWEAPKALSGRLRPPEHPKAVNHCPAIVDGEARTYEVAAPVDMHLRLGRNDKGEPSIVNVSGKDATIAAGKLNQMVTLMAQNRWRDPRRPVLQITAPYRFICDEPCWINQLPPYYHYRQPPLPGLMIGGRFPIHNWPRSLMWAFEWWDPARDLIIRRGEPWFYVRFETVDPGKPLRLVEAEMTPELREFCRGLDGITNYVNQTFQLMDRAAERRPAKLLKRRERGRPTSSAPAAQPDEPHGG